MPLTGHLNPMVALAKELESRGHQITFFGLLDAERTVRAANLDFVSFAEEEYPVGATPAAYAHLATLKGADVIRYSFQEMHPNRCAAMLKHLPERASKRAIDALVIDTIHYYVELVAMQLGLPYVHIWNVLHIDLSGMTPPCIFDWPYDTTHDAIARNKEGAEKIRAAFAPVRQIGQSWAEQQGLAINWEDPYATLSPLAQITQTPKVFDFPGIPTTPTFRYAGPLQNYEGRRTIPFDWDLLSEKPLIYASMGTIVNGLEHVFRAILDAVRELPDVQLVLSVGNNLSVDTLGPIPANAIVVTEAPQVELLQRASLCITHAGLNTVLESLSLGVPMIAIPVGFDQPGAANRISYHRLGEVQSLASITAKRLIESIRTVLEKPHYRENARYFQESFASSPGPQLAADIVEQVLQKS